jgi:uncharacterized delta-60 repeat protein
MTFTSWLSALKNSFPRRPAFRARREHRPPVRRTRPTIEVLEDRFLLSAGGLDLTFGNGGIATPDLGSKTDHGIAVARQTDGKIIEVGYLAAKSGTNEFALARYLPDGSLDSTFGKGGAVQTFITTYGAYATAVAVQPDGKIVVAGWAQVSNAYRGTGGQTDTAVVVARYNADGSFDSSFGGRKGYVITNHGGAGDGASAVALQPDGKIVVAGGAWNTGTSSDFAVIRYTTSGALDTTFGGTGIVTTDFLSVASPGYPYSYTVDSADSVMLQSDGKIVAAGSTTQGIALARYNADGSLDATYASGGKLRITSADLALPSGPVNGGLSFAGAVLQPDGKVDLAASLSLQAQNSYSVIVAIRLNGDGSLDNSFGGTGTVSYGTIYDPSQTATSSETAAAIGLDPVTGAIVVAGTFQSGGTTSLLVLRLTATGALDSGFGSGGAVTTSTSDHDFSPDALLVEPDESILVAGTAHYGATNDYDFALAHYLG